MSKLISLYDELIQFLKTYDTVTERLMAVDIDVDFEHIDILADEREAIIVNIKDVSQRMEKAMSELPEADKIRKFIRGDSIDVASGFSKDDAGLNQSLKGRILDTKSILRGINEKDVKINAAVKAGYDEAKTGLKDAQSGKKKADYYSLGKFSSVGREMTIDS